MSNNKNILNDYITKLEALKLKPSTIQACRQTVGAYLNHPSKHETYTKQKLDEFLKKISNNPNTLRKNLFILRNFWNLSGHEFPVKLSQFPQRVTGTSQAFTDDEAELLVKAASKLGQLRSTRVRNVAMIRLAYTIGLSRARVHRMNIEDVALSSEKQFVSYVWMRNSRGKWTRRIVIDERTASMLRQWISLRTRKRAGYGKGRYYGGTAEDPTPLWTNGVRGRRLALGTLSNILMRARRMAGIPKHGAGYQALKSRIDQRPIKYVKLVKKSYIIVPDATPYAPKKPVEPVMESSDVAIPKAPPKRLIPHAVKEGVKLLPNIWDLAEQRKAKESTIGSQQVPDSKQHTTDSLPEKPKGSAPDSQSRSPDTRDSDSKAAKTEGKPKASDSTSDASFADPFMTLNSGQREKKRRR